MSWQELTIKERHDLFNEIVNNSFVELSLTYAREYEKNVKDDQKKPLAELMLVLYSILKK